MALKVWRDFVLKLLTRFPMARWSPIPLRLIVGYGFMQHGFAKLSRGPGAFVAILQAMGVPDPYPVAWLTILTELLGGLAVLLGAFVTLVSVPMMAVLLVAMFKVHLPYGFSSIKLLAVTATGAKFGPVGYEVILLYLACLAALVIGGSGPFAIDGLIRKHRLCPRRTLLSAASDARCSRVRAEAAVRRLGGCACASWAGRQGAEKARIPSEDVRATRVRALLSLSEHGHHQIGGDGGARRTVTAVGAWKADGRHRRERTPR